MVIRPALEASLNTDDMNEFTRPAIVLPVVRSTRPCQASPCARVTSETGNAPIWSPVGVVRGLLAPTVGIRVLSWHVAGQARTPPDLGCCWSSGVPVRWAILGSNQ